MLTRATRILAPAHAACARSIHSAARLLAEATPASSSAAAAAAPSMPNLTAEATAAGFPRRLIRLADDVAAHRRPTQTDDGKWRKAKISGVDFSRFRQLALKSGHVWTLDPVRLRRVTPVVLKGHARSFSVRAPPQSQASWPSVPVALIVCLCLALLAYVDAKLTDIINRLDERLDPRLFEARVQAAVQLHIMDEHAAKRAMLRARGVQLTPEEERAEAREEESAAGLRAELARLEANRKPPLTVWKWIRGMIA